MDKRRNKRYDDKNSDKNEEVVRMVSLKEAPIGAIRQEAEPKVVKNPKKKRSALEVSNSIGVHGAFGITLSDLHKQGR